MSVVFYILTSVVHIGVCLIMVFFLVPLISRDWNEHGGHLHIPGIITGFCLLEMLIIKSSAASKVIRICYNFLSDPFGRRRAKEGLLFKAAGGGEILFWILLVIMIAALIKFIQMNWGHLRKALPIFLFLVLEGCILSMMLLSGRVIDIICLMIYIPFMFFAAV